GCWNQAAGNSNHLLVASAKANKIARKINQNFMLGTMCALSGIYPMTCKPEDVFGAYEFRRKSVDVFRHHDERILS
ncbi:MAG: hypothetical protein V8R63_06885, partial [Thomasclavelia ramosa]